MIEEQPGVCTTCDKLQDVCQRSVKEVQNLRAAVQKLVDQLAGFMPGENLRTFLKQLQLDERLFTIHAGGDFYKNAPMTAEAPKSNKELEDIVAERDLAKMKLGSLGRELNDLKKSHDALTKQYLERDSDIDDRQRSLAQAELKIKKLEAETSRFCDAEKRISTLEQLYTSALAPSNGVDAIECDSQTETPR